MLVDGVRGQLRAKRVMNREHPEDMFGVSEFLRKKNNIIAIHLTFNPLENDVLFH